MSGLHAGDLDREIVLQAGTFTQDPSGDPIADWTDPDEQTLWAQWWPAGTREAYLAQQRLEARIDGVFRIYDLEPRPTPDRYRIVFEGRTYDLTGVTEIGRDDGLDLSVVARAE